MIRRWLGIPKRSRGQAVAEMVLLMMATLGLGGALFHFYPDAITSLQIYIDGFYFTFSMPVP